MSYRGTVAHTAGEAESLERAAPFRWLVRAGFASRGVTYGLIGALALAIAVGAGTAGAPPNQQGALALIARTSIGGAALVVICAGLLAYAFWKFTQGILGSGPEGGGGPKWSDRTANLAGGIVYVGFFAVAVSALIGGSGNSSAAPKHAAAGILAWPGGRFIVGTAGIGLIAVSLYQLQDAVRGRFAKDNKTSRMDARAREVFMLLGRVGLTARALVFGLVGYFLVRAAIDFNPKEAVGIDGALARLHQQPLGQVLLAIAAAGLLIFAAFSLLEARYRRL